MKIILFDIDGTLVKAGGAGKLALNEAVRLLHGAKDVCSKFYLAGGTDKTNFVEAFMAAKGRKPTKKEAQIIEEKYLKLLPGEVKKAVKEKRYREIPGISGFLRSLCARKDVAVGLGTGNLKEGAVIKLRPSGLEKNFTFGGYGCDSYSRTRVLQKAVARAEKLLRIKVRGSDVYVIGDTHKDVIAAKEAGYHSGAVTAGFGELREIERAAPELIVKDFKDLKSWFIWLGIKKDPKGVRRGCYICPDTPIEHAHYGMTGLDQGDLNKKVKEMRLKKKRR